MSFELIDSAGKPIKAWVKGVQVEDDAKKQLRNLAGLPFIFKHIAVMPDVHWGMGATIGSVIATKGAIIPASVGVDLGCFVGETKIPLLNGMQYTLKYLHENKESFWVYSIDKNLNIVPGKAKCVKTRTSAQLIRVVVSGGEEIVCTPDHQFMLSDGTYVEAKDLTKKHSLMPLYRKWDTRDGYESANNGKGKSNPTHVSVWEYFNGAVPIGHVVHHIDHTQHNNSPDNLVLMTTSNHSSHHRKYGNSFNNECEDFQEKRIAGIKKRMEDPVKLQMMKDIGTKNIVEYMSNNPEKFASDVKDNGTRGAEYLVKFNTSPRECDICNELCKNPATLFWHKKRNHENNHKVILKEELDYTEDVYCLVVEEHHNFALSAGVFVHNCGMAAIRTSLVASDMPDNLHALRTEIESRIPHGRTDNGGAMDRGAWGNVPADIVAKFSGLKTELDVIVSKHPQLSKAANNAVRHLSTLGTGNHFCEICLDENQNVWIMLHSGSRGVGNKIGTYFIDKAKKDMQRWFITLPDADLAYIPTGSDLYNDYCIAVEWAQRFAKLNREIMMESAISALRAVIHKPFSCDCEAVNCHHNYISWERHFGENVVVTRKGAVRAGEGELGIIPGSMGAKSFIVRGKGNRESFCSCSHGAGRAMSRNEARRRFSIDDHIAATSGVECRKDSDVIDETPAAYKDIDSVMSAQSELVDIVHTLKQIVCVKG